MVIHYQEEEVVQRSLRSNSLYVSSTDKYQFTFIFTSERYTRDDWGGLHSGVVIGHSYFQDGKINRKGLWWIVYRGKKRRTTPPFESGGCRKRTYLTQPGVKTRIWRTSSLQWQIFKRQDEQTGKRPGTKGLQFGNNLPKTTTTKQT